MKSNSEIVLSIRKEIEKRNKEIQKIVQQLEGLKVKDPKDMTTEAKVNLVKYATALSEHKAVINTLENILKD